MGTPGTRGFSRVRREFSVLAEGRHVFGRRPKPREKLEKAFRAGHYKDLTETTGNRARKVSGTQGNGWAKLEKIKADYIRVNLKKYFKMSGRAAFSPSF